MIRSSVSSTFLVAFFCLCSPSLNGNNGTWFQVATAQEYPSIQMPQFSSNTTYRQDVCDRHKNHASGIVNIRDSLKGLQLHPIIRVNQFFRLDETGAIDEEYPGYIAVVLDEIGRRAGFTWRDSFAISDRPSGDRSFTDLILWGVENYDIFCSWFDLSLERLQYGISFPEGLIEANYILVGRDDLGDTRSSEQGRFGFELWNWLEPFQGEVWWLISFTIIASGLLYTVLDQFDLNPDERQLRRGYMLRWTPCYLSFLTFTQHFQFVPRSHGTRVLSVSLAFWALLVSATYTANLASFFVINNTPTFAIQDIDGAVQANYAMCVFKGASIDTYITRRYPKATLVRKESEKASYKALLDGECDLVASQYSSWKQLENDRSVNSQCNLVWIGRVIKFVPAGFATIADAGTLCTSLIRDVINVHLVEMKGDGFLDAAWEEYLRRDQDIDCGLERRKTTTGTATDDNDNARLGLKEMAGTFIMHWFMVIVAILVSLCTRLYDKCYSQKERMHQGRTMSLPDPARNFPNTGSSYADPSTRTEDASDDIPGPLPGRSVDPDNGTRRSRISTTFPRDRSSRLSGVSELGVSSRINGIGQVDYTNQARELGPREQSSRASGTGWLSRMSRASGTGQRQSTRTSGSQSLFGGREQAYSSRNLDFDFDTGVGDPIARNSMLDPVASRNLATRSSALNSLWRSHDMQWERQRKLEDIQNHMSESQRELSTNQKNLMENQDMLMLRQEEQNEQIAEILELLKNQRGV